jgi:AbrB family looped-hinge helix DNA binding protein
MEIELTKISTKGQIVIPQKIRDKLKIKEGETLAISAEKDLLVLKKINNPLEDDLETIKEINSAWKEIKMGNFKKLSSEQFIEEIKKW